MFGYVLMEEEQRALVSKEEGTEQAYKATHKAGARWLGKRGESLIWSLAAASSCDFEWVTLCTAEY